MIVANQAKIFKEEDQACFEEGLTYYSLKS